MIDKLQKIKLIIEAYNEEILSSQETISKIEHVLNFGFDKSELPLLLDNVEIKNEMKPSEEAKKERMPQFDLDKTRTKRHFTEFEDKMLIENSKTRKHTTSRLAEILERNPTSISQRLVYLKKIGKIKDEGIRVSMKDLIKN
jgi:predicted HTH transcriptional regulator